MNTERIHMAVAERIGKFFRENRGRLMFRHKDALRFGTVRRSKLNGDPGLQALGLCLLFVLMVLAMSAYAPYRGHAAALEYRPWSTIEGEVFFSRQEGRMGLDQENDGVGTLNDFSRDLGLELDNITWRIRTSARPLEHHVVRLYGSIPEFYNGSTVLERDLVTRTNIYPAGSRIQSELYRASYGFGYDLDLLVGPTWYGGFNGDLRYFNVKARMMQAGTGREDTVTLAELVPCLGAHANNRFTLSIVPGRSTALGGYARMVYGITPNFLNYVEINLGLSLDMRWQNGLNLTTRVGYEHESLFHDQEAISGRILEIQRDGITVSIGAAF